jgi:hypothetical protein
MGICDKQQINLTRLRYASMKTIHDITYRIDYNIGELGVSWQQIISERFKIV